MLCGCSDVGVYGKCLVRCRSVKVRGVRGNSGGLSAGEVYSQQARRSGGGREDGRCSYMYANADAYDAVDEHGGRLKVTLFA